MNLANRAFSTILAGALFAQPAAAELTKIGAAAAVKGRVNAVAPDTKVGRVIESGKTLYLNDHVTTDAAGHLQVLLVDETVFTLGPSSDMVLDQFVYDPDSHAGKVAASFVKGTFRFVTGKVAHRDPEQMKIKLAVGTIGIRGSVGVVQTDANGSTVINAGAGSGNNAGESSAGIFVSNEGQTTDLSRPGFGTTIGAGQPPAPATDMSGQLNGIMGNLAPGGAGGAGNGGGQAGNVGGGGNVGETSGQNTATGGVLAGDSTEADALAAGAQVAQNNAAQDTANGFVQGNGFFFSGPSGISCTGTGCTGGGPFQGAVQLYVDWTNRTFGGGGSSDPTGAVLGPSTIDGSFIHMHNINTPSDTIEQIIGGGGSGINRIPFGTTVPGTITLTNGANGNLGPLTGLSGASGNFFQGTTIAVSNSVDVPASVNLTFSGTTSSSQSINASGSFSAPYTAK